MNNELLDKYKISDYLNTTISGKLIYTLLKEIADRNGEVQISISKISNIIKISKTTVRQNLHRLEQNRYIYIRKMYSEDGGRIANKYILR